MQQQFGSAKNTVTGRFTGAKDNLVSDSKDAIALGLEITAGQAALSVIRSFVIPAKVSLLDKLTGKGAFIKKVANSAYGSLAIAATANVIVSVIAPKNVKLNKITKLALNAAVIEATTHIPLQEWTDKLAGKLLNNKAVDAVFGDDDK